MNHHLFIACRRVFAVGVCSALLSMSSISIAAQQAPDSITGTVMDPRGGLLPRATITLRNETTGAVTRAATDGVGHFASTALPAGLYTVEATVAGFATTVRRGVRLGTEVSLSLSIDSTTDQVTVEAGAAGSIASALAPMDALLEARSARTEISSAFVQNFTSPISDYSEIVQQVPGTFSVNANGIGLGDSKTYFRGFSDGNYDISFDGIPFEDTNSPTHHSWSFFPSPWIGGVDFDRSPGSASTVGPTPFGGSINLLSRDIPADSNFRGGVTYGSFNTLLLDFQADSGSLFPSKKFSLTADFNRLTSDGYETFNYQMRNAGSLKAQYKFSDKSVLTGFSGVLAIDSNTPNLKGPTRAQVTQFGMNYLLQNTDPTAVNYYKYNFYHIPTDFEYISFKTEFAHGLQFDTRPYTYSYYNQQNYPLAIKTAGGISSANCIVKGVVQNCGTDKLNSYRRYGDVTTLSQVSRFGIFRAGMWYEFAKTDRHQIPQDPTTLTDNTVPNFNEQFNTGTYQPFVEYEYHATPKLTITGGLKFAYYTFDLNQHSDNGGAIGTLPNGQAAVEHKASFHSYLPSADVNYRIRQNWSIYAQYGTGSVIPPTSVFDVSNVASGTLIANPVTVLPKPSYARTYQGGSVVKMKRVALDADVYYVRFGNAYTSSPDPNATGASEYQSSGDSTTKGFEGEVNVYVAKGLSLYGSGTVGSARYISQTLSSSTSTATVTVTNPNYQRWVANTPANTEGLGVTYQRRNIDLGFFDKRIGPMWNDGKSTFNSYTGTTVGSFTANQFIPIDAFSIANLFMNYTVRNGSQFDQTKIRLSFNNLFNHQSFTGVTAATAGSITAPTFVASPGDNLTILPPRSINLTVTFGYSPKR